MNTQDLRRVFKVGKNCKASLKTLRNLRFLYLLKLAGRRPSTHPSPPSLSPATEALKAPRLGSFYLFQPVPFFSMSFNFLLQS